MASNLVTTAATQRPRAYVDHNELEARVSPSLQVHSAMASTTMMIAVTVGVALLLCERALARPGARGPFKSLAPLTAAAQTSPTDLSASDSWGLRRRLHRTCQC